MVGPFAQGFFLMGIIYWYSKGLMNLINDYYRSEFNRKLKTTPIDQRNLEFKPQTYDLDDMEQLIQMEILKDKVEEMEPRQQMPKVEEENYRNFTEWLPNRFEIGNSCYRPNRKIEFLNILFQFDDEYIGSYRMTVLYKHNINYDICLLNENVT